MHEFYVGSLGATMRYHDLPGDELPIVIIHGMGCASSFDYVEVAAQPELAQHRRLLVDLIGAGFSDRLDSFDFTPASHARYLRDFLEQLDLKEFFLFGHSMGGAIAIELATFLPASVKTLILSEPNLDPSPIGALSRHIADQNESHYLSQGHNSLIQSSRGTPGETWVASMHLWTPASMYRSSKALAQGGAPSWRHALYDLRCPRYCLIGEKAPADILAGFDLPDLKDHDVKIIVVPGGNHSMAWELPDATAQAIAQAMRNID